MGPAFSLDPLITTDLARINRILQTCNSNSAHTHANNGKYFLAKMGHPAGAKGCSSPSVLTLSAQGASKKDKEREIPAFPEPGPGEGGEDSEALALCIQFKEAPKTQSKKKKFILYGD